MTKFGTHAEALAALRGYVVHELARRYDERALREMANFVNGTSYDVSRVGTGETPIIRISNITNPRSEYLQTSQEFAQRFHVEPGDLLVSWSASFKTILWPGPPGILNQHIFRVSEQPEVDKSFLRHSIEAALTEIRENAVGIGMMHVRRDDFLDHTVSCPPLEVQTAVGQYLDWVEASGSGSSPNLPGELSEVLSVAERFRSLAQRCGELAELHSRNRAAVQAVSSSWFNRFASDSKQVCLRELLTLRAPDVQVDPEQLYDFAGVYSFGRGVFRGMTKPGSEFSYTKLTRLRVGEFVYPKLMAWEGAFGITQQEHSGLVVSPEFPVFSIDTTRLLPTTIGIYFAQPDVWRNISGISRGTNVRRRRLHPKVLLEHELPLPSMEHQVALQRIVGLSEQVSKEQAAITHLVSALIPSLAQDVS